MTNEELEAARLAMLASYESAASEGSDSSVDSVEEINPDDQMRMAESRRSEGIMVGSVMDFALSLVRPPLLAYRSAVVYIINHKDHCSQ